MPWVRLDDRFPSHRKISLLSDRAFRLYVSALCWSSENLTEGMILDRELPVLTRIRGAKAAAKDLESAGLWDRVEGGWVVHDYLEYNPDRSKVQAERAANAARQQAFRDRKRAEREAQQALRNAGRNGVTAGGSESQKSTTATRTRHDGDTNAQENDLANHSSLQVNAFRNGVSNGTPSRPRPLLPPTEVELASPDAPEQLPIIGPQPRIPASCRPLVDALTDARMAVGWDETTSWLLIEALIKRCGTEMLVDHAVGQWQRAKSRPQTGNYFVPGWRTLPDRPTSLPGVLRQPTLPAGPPTRNQIGRGYLDNVHTGESA